MWPNEKSVQSDWTLWAHYTLATAMTNIYPYPSAVGMSLRASRTKKDPSLWPSAVTLGVVKDWKPKQQGLDFCLMGPTGARQHFLTAESECDPWASVSISLSEEGYIWDWSKLLGNVSQHRLLFATVGGSGARRANLRANMVQFFANTHNGSVPILYPEGIGGYIIGHSTNNRIDSYTFVVNNGVVEFSLIPPNLL